MALAAAPSPLPVILTVILTLGSALMKASANASAVGHTAVAPPDLERLLLKALSNMR